jgi:LuxR family transcriptional regulator, maltose regulon positive regulatory protein
MWLRSWPRSPWLVTGPRVLQPLRAVPGAPAVALAEPLSDREHEVLRLLAAGLPGPEIARALIVAPSTVKSHLKSIYGKLAARGRVQAITRARALRLL